MFYHIGIVSFPMNNTYRLYEIDFVRFFLIIAVVIVHIANFGSVHPEAKSVILSFLMPTFLLLTGYLVNVEKSPREFVKYLIRLFLPYAIMVIGYSVMSFYLPVQDRLTEMSFDAIMDKVFITSIGPYWFLQTMIVCGIVYYACFHFLRSHFELTSILYVLCIALIFIADNSPVLSIKAASYYFLGVALRQTHVTFNGFFKKSPFAFLPIIILLLHKDMRDWGSIAILAVAYCLISFLSWLGGLVCEWSLCKYILFVGANTLPIYLFHPIFTMLAKFYLPLFAFDSTGIIHAITTVVIALLGSLLIALIMEKSRLSYLFYRPTFFVKPNEQNDACINSAMARKGGCEETNDNQKEIENEKAKCHPKPNHHCCRVYN